MSSTRNLRWLESGLVSLFFIQAIRLLSGILLSSISIIITDPQSNNFPLFSMLGLIGCLIFPVIIHEKLFRKSPKLLGTVIIIGSLRFLMSLGDPLLAEISALLLMSTAIVYYSTLLKVNHIEWSAGLIFSILFDLMLRAFDSYDISLKPWIDIALNNALYRIPGYLVQIPFILFLTILGRHNLRNSSRSEDVPGTIELWNGLALGGFFSLQLIVLALPNVISRWSSIPYESIYPWITLAVFLPLLPGVHAWLGYRLEMFESNLKGWLIFFAIFVLIILGYRIDGIIASSALIIAEFLSVMLLWWIPKSKTAEKKDRSALAIALGLFVYFSNLFIYSMTFDTGSILEFLQGQALLLLMLSCFLMTLPFIIAPSSNPWKHKLEIINTPALRTLGILIVGTTSILALPHTTLHDPPGDHMKVGSYNINYGYDETGKFQLDSIALAIKASEADVLVLHEVDTGHPMNYGIDQVEYLSKHFHMYDIYESGFEQLRGIAILSKYPITLTASDILATSGGTALMISGEISRNEIEIPIQILGSTFVVSSQAERLAQFALVRNILDQDLLNIVGIDLGGSVDDAIFNQLHQLGLIDPDEELGIDSNNTYPSSEPAIRQDVILVSGLIPQNSFQVDSAASDHRLIIVEFE